MFANPSMSRWRKFRIAASLLCFVAGFATVALQSDSAANEQPFPFPLSPFSILGLLAMPFVLSAVISFQAMNPLSDQYWSPPTHDDNPFHLGNPLRFFHFASFQVSAFGMGMTIAALCTRLDFLISGIFMMLGGLSTLAGVHLAMRFCKRKIK